MTIEHCLYEQLLQSMCEKSYLDSWSLGVKSICPEKLIDLNQGLAEKLNKKIFVVECKPCKIKLKLLRTVWS